MIRCTMKDIGKVSGVMDEGLAYDALKNDGIFVLMPEKCVFIFVPYNEQLYFVHINSKSEDRGAKMVSECHRSFAWMFVNTECIKISGLINISDKAAMRFVSLLGVDKEGVLKDALEIKGKKTDYALFGYAKP